MSFSMHKQNLIKFYKVVPKILSGNKIMTDWPTDGQNERQPKSNIAPLFQGVGGGGVVGGETINIIPVKFGENLSQ